MKKKLVPITLLAIFVFALLIRLYRLDTLPLYADETGHYQLLAKIVGRDTNFFSLIYYKLILGSFSSTWLFGLSFLGARSAAAIYGATLTLVGYFFSLTLRKNYQAALLTALLIGITPWSFMIGRIGHTAMPILLLLIFLHVAFFITAKTIKKYLLSLFFLATATIYYPSMVIIAPMVAAFVAIEIVKIIPRPRRTAFYLVGGISMFLLVLAMAKQFSLFSTSGRALDLAIWRDVNTPYDIDKYRGLSWNSQPSLFSFGLAPEQLANKLFLNRIMANLSIFARNYLSFFSPDWLFLRGDAVLRHSTGMIGAFYPFLLPFMLYGAFRFFKTPDPKTRNLFLIWILVSPIPAALTKDGAGYLLRAVTMLPFLTYFCTLGLVGSFNLVRKNWHWPYGAVIAVIALYSAWSFFYGYFHVYPALSARAYEYGFKELSDFQVASGGKTMLIVWDGYYPVGHFLFWQKVPFVEYEKMKITPIRVGETTFWKTLPNLYFTVPKDTKNVVQFIKDYQPSYLVLPDRYFVKYDDDLLELTKEKVTEIRYPDQTIALSIYTVR